jgi:HD-GYP domain-containing protein (c-di-GMP phosphodiesterase class II)
MVDLQMKRDLTTQEVLDLLFSYTPKIAGEKDIDRLLILMANLGRELVVADRCTLWLLSNDGQTLWTRVAHGVPEIRMPADKGFAGEAVRTGEPIIIKDAYEDSRFNREIDLETGYRTQAMMVMPIRTNDGRVMGAFQAINKMTPDGGFTQKDLEHLNLTATYSGKTLESAMLYEEVEVTQRDAIYMLGELAESRSRETGNHVKRVAEYCALLGKYLGLSVADIDLLKLASPMHDAGKVATPDAILKKPGRLTEEEMETMKLHTEEGRMVLSRSVKRIFQTAAEIAITHHEKWNGKGYPKGLAGEDIPLFGRIVAVADVFDALSNDRCYKKAWPIEKVAQLFQEELGLHFDPKIGQILLDHLPEFVQINFIFRDTFVEGPH